MLQTQGAIFFVFTLMTDWTFSIVTVHAVVVTATTVVCSDIAAIVALILDIGLFMLLTVGDAKFVIGFLPEKLAFWTLHLILIKDPTK
jgi:hypothetical protein